LSGPPCSPYKYGPPVLTKTGARPLRSTLVKQVILFLTAAVLLAAGLGCGNSEKDRGKNSQLDRPRSTASKD